jgi:hypothetical protein
VGCGCKLKDLKSSTEQLKERQDTAIVYTTENDTRNETNIFSTWTFLISKFVDCCSAFSIKSDLGEEKTEGGNRRVIVGVGSGSGGLKPIESLCDNMLIFQFVTKKDKNLGSLFKSV